MRPVSNEAARWLAKPDGHTTLEMGRYIAPAGAVSFHDSRGHRWIMNHGCEPIADRANTIIDVGNGRSTYNAVAAASTARRISRWGSAGEEPRTPIDDGGGTRIHSGPSAPMLNRNGGGKVQAPPCSDHRPGWRAFSRPCTTDRIADINTGRGTGLLRCWRAKRAADRDPFGALQKGPLGFVSDRVLLPRMANPSRQRVPRM